MTLINQSAVRQLALKVAREARPAAGFERVGSAFLERINAAVALAVRREVEHHPSVGKTLK